MKRFLLACAAVGALVAVAEPVIPADSVKLTQTENGRVRISYRLENEDAIVTMSVSTGGVAIARGIVQHVSGDVNRSVAQGDRQIIWRAYKDLPNLDLRGEDGLRVELQAWSRMLPPDYMVVDLTKPHEVLYYPSERDLPEGTVNCDTYKTVKMAFRRIPAGHVAWCMGTGGAFTGVRHAVTLSEDFYIGVFEVTAHQHGLIMGSAEPSGRAAANPLAYGTVRGADWPSAPAPSESSALGRLRAHAGGGFDLPLEAQWEFACRAGSHGVIPYSRADDGSLYKPSKNLIGTYLGNGSATDPVGSYLPNAYGLYDMLGGHVEWCRDWYSDDATCATVDPEVGATTGSTHVYRSSSYHWDWGFDCGARMSSSSIWDDMPGYRIACTVGLTP